ncbi:AraC family transcriptional regulator [uncultured Albimonas sp.]|uniref:AraC family transcriptional regulator n=1 Tax=uncultured Albimonas sp. TaxID=1331701 RepID=UPI0030EBBACD
MAFDAASPPDLPAAPALAFALLDGIRAALLHDPRRAREELGRLDRLLDETARFGAVRGGLAPWQERRVRRLVEAGIDGPLPVERLAAEASLGASQFARAFKESFGVAPHAWVLARRLDHACRLIAGTDEPLGRIAAQCGLADQAHLTRLFRSRLGTTPGAWRRQARERPVRDARRS